MPKKEGNIFGGILLIAGSCIGAGMLGLPILTGLAGFFPSLLMFLVVWVFMTLTGLLLVEVNSWHSNRVNMLTMVGSSLGKWGRAACWVFYLFLFYALLVAYISGSGNLVATFSAEYLRWNVPAYAGSLFFVLLFGYLVYLGTRQVDLCNRFLMGVKILAFLSLIVLGARYIDPVKLLHKDSTKMLATLPLLVTAFGFHNMVPSLNAYMNGNTKKVRLAILGGSFFTLIVYLVWQVLAMGIIPLKGPSGLEESFFLGQEAAQAIGAILRSSSVGFFAQILGFFAILTSFLAQALSLTHFLADGFKVDHKKQENLGLCALALIPPLVLAIFYPDIFFKALNFAGGFCAVILFGMLPILMVWKGRYSQRQGKSFRVFGGKPLLIVIFLFSLYIFIYQTTSMLRPLV